MKAVPLPLFLSALLAAATLHAQQAPIEAIPGPISEPVIAVPADPVNDPDEIPQPEAIAPPATDVPDDAPDMSQPDDAPIAPDDIPQPPVNPAEPEATGVAPFGPLEQQKLEMSQSDEGFIIKDAAINDIFQYLAKEAGRQYFHNAKITGSDYLVTGHLNNGNPLLQMEELAFQYSLSLHVKGNTIYALTQAQLSQLPSTEFHYQLRYLRPTDMEQIKDLIKPILSPGTGIVNFEPKTNTIVIIDSTARIEQVRSLLHGIDKAQGQIIVETKILRINSNAAERTGVNWSSSLGKNGVTLDLARDLNSVFGLPSSPASSILGGDGTNLVLSPVQLGGVLRALDEGGLASQISNPTLITEDNEQATISIIDRIPIITTSSTANTSGGNPTVTEEVRYKVDEDDKPITEDPTNHREIGISLVVTPTLLPDGTVRMKLRPRSAQVTGKVLGAIQSGGYQNEYPKVNESMIETLARVPDGYSLIVGGFYGEVQSNNKTKVPLLGDIPVLNFFFKSKETTKEKTSLVFVVTPKSYDPVNGRANNSASQFIRNATTLDCDHDWIDQDNPGPAHEPNIQRTIRGMQPKQAPYYPRAEELAPRPQPTVIRDKPRFSRAKR